MNYKEIITSKVNICYSRGHHNYVHGHRRIYCWDCFHNGMIDETNLLYSKLENISRKVPIDLQVMKDMKKLGFDDFIVPIEYRIFFKK